CSRMPKQDSIQQDGTPARNIHAPCRADRLEKRMDSATPACLLAAISSRSSRHFATRPTRDYSRFAWPEYLSASPACHKWFLCGMLQLCSLNFLSVGFKLRYVSEKVELEASGEKFKADHFGLFVNNNI
ncbi:MAG: hypothetical protein Q7U12_06495, partial [Undibacterium sp.]|nr:hypothetical protein [Undibacterium sp.]